MYELMCGYGYVRMGARVCNNVSIYVCVYYVFMYGFMYVGMCACIMYVCVH